MGSIRENKSLIILEEAVVFAGLNCKTVHYLHSNQTSYIKRNKKQRSFFESFYAQYYQLVTDYYLVILSVT